VAAHVLLPFNYSSVNAKITYQTPEALIKY